MPIDLNKLPHTTGESLPDLNEEPAHEEEQEDQVHLQVHSQGGHPLPDLNEEPPDKQEDETHHLQKDEVRVLVDDEVHWLQEAQSYLFQEDEEVPIHPLLDLNVKL